MATEERLVREGRLFSFPKKNWTTITVANIDLDRLGNALRTPLLNYLRSHEKFRALYDGTAEDISDAITGDVDMFITQCLYDTWNRLRFIAETHHYPTREANMPRKAPVLEGFKVPKFYSNVLSSIGPLVVDDAPYSTIIIYSPAEANRNNYGRAADQVGIMNDDILRFVARMETISVDLAPVDTKNPTGSFFTTCSLEAREGDSYTLYGLLNSRFYTRQDVAMALLFSAVGTDTYPFQDVGLTIGFVNIEAVTAAIEALAPDDAPGQPAANVARPVLGTISVAYSGVAPAANHPVNQRGRGIYVFGRGHDRLGCFSLARGLRKSDIDSIIRDRIISEHKKKD